MQMCVYSIFTYTNYAKIKFLNEEIKYMPEGSSNLNPTDAPVIRYGEVLMNYAEAAAELGTLTQEDLDKSINQLRARGEGVVPPLQDRKSTRLNSSHVASSYAVSCLKRKTEQHLRMSLS